jgi:hypothetical protein
VWNGGLLRHRPRSWQQLLSGSLALFSETNNGYVLL